MIRSGKWRAVLLVLALSGCTAPLGGAAPTPQSAATLPAPALTPAAIADQMEQVVWRDVQAFFSHVIDLEHGGVQSQL